MTKTIWLDLQLFADGGDGGDGSAGAAASGDTAAVAAQPVRSLEELGVPKDRIERLKKRANRSVRVDADASAIVTNSAPVNPAQTTEGQAAADEKQTSKPEENAKPTWEDLMKDPDYNRRMQEVVQARLKEDKGAKETLQKLAPILESLGAKYEMDTSDIGKLDIDALQKAVENDASYYEKKADELGVTPDTARQLDQLQKFKQQQAEQQRISVEQQAAREHLTKLINQGEELKKVFPNFNLQTELQNPVFQRMTHPSVGLSVEDAYYAIHRQEIQQASLQATARNVEQKVAASVAANKARPSENGLASQASSQGTFDVRHLTKEQREGIKAQMREAKVAGKKLYPHQVFGAR